MYIANKYNTLWWFTIYRKFRVDQKLTVFLLWTTSHNNNKICYAPIIIGVEFDIVGVYCSIRTIRHTTQHPLLILPCIVVLFPYHSYYYYDYYYLYISTNFEILFCCRVCLLSGQFWCHLSISGTDLLWTFLQLLARLRLRRTHKMLSQIFAELTIIWFLVSLHFFVLCTNCV